MSKNKENKKSGLVTKVITPDVQKVLVDGEVVWFSVPEMQDGFVSKEIFKYNAATSRKINQAIMEILSE